MKPTTQEPSRPTVNQHTHSSFLVLVNGRIVKFHAHSDRHPRVGDIHTFDDVELEASQARQEHPSHQSLARKSTPIPPSETISHPGLEPRASPIIPPLSPNNLLERGVLPPSLFKTPVDLRNEGFRARPFNNEATMSRKRQEQDTTKPTARSESRRKEVKKFFTGLMK